MAFAGGNLFTQSGSQIAVGMATSTSENNICMAFGENSGTIFVQQILFVPTKSDIRFSRTDRVLQQAITRNWPGWHRRQVIQALHCH